jgi:hypothetical protein
MKFTVVMCLLLLCISASAQVIYKTIKADGSIVYSDVHSDGAEPIKLSSMNTVVVPALNNAASQKSNASKQIKKRVPELQYLVSIRSPAPKSTLRNNAGTVSINAEVSPKKSGKFELLLDNQVIKTQSKSLFELEGVERGAHIIQVNFIDNSGKTLASSMPQTFYLHKTSALINAN